MAQKVGRREKGDLRPCSSPLNSRMIGVKGRAVRLWSGVPSGFPYELSRFSLPHALFNTHFFSIILAQDIQVSK